jgi:hypothetical protein
VALNTTKQTNLARNYHVNGFLYTIQMHEIGF